MNPGDAQMLLGGWPKVGESIATEVWLLLVPLVPLSMAGTSIRDGGGSWSLFCCRESSTDGSWKLERKPLSPSSHLPTSPTCPPIRTTQQEASWQGSWRNGVWGAPPRLEGVGSELRDNRFTPETREQRIWSQKAWVLSSARKNGL